MWETLRIVEEIRPKYVLWENVKNLLSHTHIHNYRNYMIRMSELGYNNYYQVLNAKDFEIPQNRERVFTLSIRRDVDNGKFQFPKPKELKLELKDFLEEDVEGKYFISNKRKKTLLSRNDKWQVRDSLYEINREVSNTITTREGCTRSDTSEYICNELPKCCNILKVGNLDNFRIRRLTPKECWRLMGFSDTDFEKAEKVNSNAQLYKQAGNSIVVNVLERILENLFLREENDFEGQMNFNMLGE